MKFNTIRGTSAVIITGLLIAGCTTVKKAAKKYDEGSKYKAEPEVLEVHGDSVEYQMTVEIDPKALNKKTTVELNPALHHAGKVTPRPQVTVEGEKVKKPSKKATTIQSKAGGKVTVKDKFRYDTTMSTSELKVAPRVMIRGTDEVQDQCIILPPEIVARGMITTSQLMMDAEASMESGDKYEAVHKNVDIELYYLINSSRFNPDFKVKSAKIDNREQINKLKELGKDTAYLIKGISINGTASPDGELRINEKLSKERAESTFDYLTKQLKKLGFDEVNDSAYTLSYSMTEDWEGWKNLVGASDLSDREEILSIMNSGMNNDAKEMEIKRTHAKSYDKMRDEMLPLLRRSKITFARQTPLKTDDELRAIGDKDLNQLEVVELMQLARVYDKKEDKLRVYNHVVQKYPNDWRGYNNVAYVYLMDARTADAMPMLDKANELSPNNSIVLNNYGVAYAIMKDYVKAEDYYKQAQAAGVNEDNNMGLLYLRKGQYNEAIEMMKDKCEFNVALAYTLKGEYDNAKSSLECVKLEKRNALYYYLYSIIGARTNNLEMVTTNLTRSIQMDEKMRNMAKNDLEFRKVKDRAEFQNAIR